MSGVSSLEELGHDADGDLFGGFPTVRQPDGAVHARQLFLGRGTGLPQSFEYDLFLAAAPDQPEVAARDRHGAA